MSSTYNKDFALFTREDCHCHNGLQAESAITVNCSVNQDKAKV